MRTAENENRQYMQIEFTKGVEFLRKSQTEIKCKMKISVNQIKSSMESLINRREQVEQKMSGLKDKAVELGHSAKENVKPSK